MQVCIHEPNSYKIQSVDNIPNFSHDPLFVVNPDSLTGKVWNPDAGPVYWKLDTDTPDIAGIDTEIELFKRVFLQISMETDLVIRRKKRLSSEAQIVVTFTHEDPFFKNNRNTLAYAYGPSEGIGSDITFNDNLIWTLDGKPFTALEAYEKGLISGFENPENLIRTWDAQHTGTHEGGHAVGAPHIPEVVGEAIMNPFYNGLRRFTKADLELLWRLNGKANISHKIKEMLLTRIGAGVA